MKSCNTCQNYKEKKSELCKNCINEDKCKNTTRGCLSFKQKTCGNCNNFNQKTKNDCLKIHLRTSASNTQEDFISVFPDEKCEWEPVEVCETCEGNGRICKRPLGAACVLFTKDNRDCKCDPKCCYWSPCPTCQKMNNKFCNTCKYGNLIWETQGVGYGSHREVLCRNEEAPQYMWKKRVDNLKERAIIYMINPKINAIIYITYPAKTPPFSCWKGVN
jgi:hypothetical protein